MLPNKILTNLDSPVSITGIASVSPLGHEPADIWRGYRNPESIFGTFENAKGSPPAGFLPENSRNLIDEIRSANPKYKSLDDSVLFAIAASREAIKNAGWNQHDSFGINIGSSRGATGLFEKYHAEFLKSGTAATLTSPTTTLGNIASWVAQDLQNNGPEISHSITCSTALHALLNGIAWLRSGMADKFLVGGSEAPLTAFTIAQMQAMKIYSKAAGEFPCRSLDLDKKQNTMVLGEGAAACCIEAGHRKNAIALIDGIGYATELIENSTSISAEAQCFQKSMRMAMQNANPSRIDAIVMHTPGTIAGDLAEAEAVKKVFGKHHPLLTSGKWKTGHTFGASGMLSMEMAVMMLMKNEFLPVPFLISSDQTRDLRKIMVNSVGFGGNAVSVVLSKP